MSAFVGWYKDSKLRINVATLQSSQCVEESPHFGLSHGLAIAAIHQTPWKRITVALKSNHILILKYLKYRIHLKIINWRWRLKNYVKLLHNVSF